MKKLFVCVSFIFIAAVTASAQSSWQSGDIGAVSAQGAYFSCAGFTVNGNGFVSSTSDSFHYVYRQINGDVTIVARVASIEKTSNYAKAGVMIRESLNSNSRHASMLITASSNAVLRYRLNTAGSSADISSGPLRAPYWVKLVRAGNSITASVSADGITFVSAGKVTLNSLSSQIYVGLAVTSDKAGMLNTSVFDSVSVNVPVANQAPSVQAFASPNSGYAPLPVQFNANASDSDGQIVSYSWTFGDGGTSTAANPTRTYQTAGTYTAQVTVTDNQGALATSSVVVVATSLPNVSALSLNPTSITGGGTSQGTVTLSGPAPSGGAVVNLSSNNAAATVPASVTVAAGSSSATFQVSSTSVSVSTSVTISASYNSSSRSASLTLQPAAVSLSSLSLNPTSTIGGTSSQATVALSGAAPSGGAVVTVSTSNTTVTAVPASVTVPAGSTSATFQVSTNSVSSSTSVTITATRSGVTRTATLTVNPAADTTAPAISAVASSSITTSGATVTWTTNEASNTQVEYGTTTSYGSSTTLNTTMLTAHSATLSGLSAGTLYNYRVKSRDAAGNLATSGNFTFTTSSSTSSAGDFYVATTGSDSNPGTQTQPFRTITRGIDALSSGKTLVIRGGTYAESINTSINDVPSGSSWSAATTIKASAGETVVLRPASGTFVLLVSGYAHSYIVFDGLVFDAASTDNAVSKLTDGANHIRIANCEIRNSARSHGLLITNGNGSTGYNEVINTNIHDNGNSWVGPISPPHGIYVGTPNNLFDNCNIHHNNNGYGVHAYGDNPDSNIIRNSSIHHNQDGILLDGSNNLVFNNLLYAHGIDIRVSDGSGDAAVGNLIYNNTCYESGAAIHVGASVPGVYASNTMIRNNICYASFDGEQQIQVFMDASNTVIENNLTRMVILNLGSGTAMSANVRTNPMFINAAANDFHLQSGSPAVNTGRTVTEVLKDKDGITRPSSGAYDIGAYER